MNSQVSTRFLFYFVSGVACTIVLGGFAFFLGVSGFIGEETLVNPLDYFDAVNYARIAGDGYRGLYLHAFFPLFPLILKVLASGWLASAFNALIFCISAAAMASELRPSFSHFLLYLTLPSCIFFLLPYSEALFFSGGTIFLLSLRREALWMGALGLLIAGLSRPAVSVFLPALLLLFWLNPKVYRLKPLLIHSLAVLASFFGAWYIQYLWNGEWALFFEAQKGWGNELSFPDFPFSTWGSDNTILWLDLFALSIGIAAGAYLVYLGIKRLRGQAITSDSAGLFSMLYLVGICAMILVFRGGGLFSLNRFVLAVPFAAWIIFSGSLKTVAVRWLYLALSLLALLFILHGAYVHIRVVLGAMIFLVVAALWLAGLHSGQKKWAFAAVLAALLSQGYFLLKLVRKEWIAELLPEGYEIVLCT